MRFLYFAPSRKRQTLTMEKTRWNFSDVRMMAKRENALLECCGMDC